jgi:hypothetical protein
MRNPGSLVRGFLLWLFAFGLYALIPVPLGPGLRGGAEKPQQQFVTSLLGILLATLVVGITHTGSLP